MSWLITGGCGFIGRNLIDRLKAEGTLSGVRVVDNLSTGLRAELEAICPVILLDAETLVPVEPVPAEPHVQLVVGDIRDSQLAMRVAQGFKVVVHLAANTGVAPSVAEPMLDCTTNVLGTLNYLEAARHGGASRFVFASSGAPVGECVPPLHEELPAHPVSPYGASKLAGEAYCSAYKRTFGLDTVCLRFSNVYGPLSGHKSSVVAKFIREGLEGRAWHIFGDGNQTRDFIHIHDLIEAICLAASRPNVGGEVFQIASNVETTVGELAVRLRGVLERFGVKACEIVHEDLRPGDVTRNFADTSKARRVLGWNCTVGLDTGLEMTVRWFLDQKAAGRT